MSPSLRLRQTQRLALTPGVRMGMQVLAMPVTELSRMLTEEAERNPLLVVEDAARPDRPAPSESVIDVISRTVAAPESLGAHLRRQLSDMELPEPVAQVAAWLTGDLDERGYLVATPAEIAAETGVDDATVRQALAALQSCEPAGIGARSLSECLVLQLVALGLTRAQAVAVVPVLGAARDGDAAAVRAALPDGPFDCAALAAMARRLTPNPAAGFEAGPAEGLLRPELTVQRRADGGLAVHLVEGTVPRVWLDRALLARSRGDAGARPFAEAQRQGAERLIAALRFRGRTLLRVGEAVVTAHAGWFAGAQARPGPLSRQDIALRLGLHPATVGRAVAGRSLDWQGRAIPLSWFFPAPAGTGTGMSNLEVQERIARLVADETGAEVLSDDEIAARLREEGVDIARRTVAKYRKCLNIPSSHRRRRRLAVSGPGVSAGRVGTPR
jgi:RNA polymerase sigma-54 factor